MVVKVGAKSKRKSMQEIREAKLEFLDGYQLIAGIDLAKEKHYGQFLKCDRGRMLSHFSMTNDAKGFAKMKSQVEATGIPAQQVIIGMESTGAYGQPFNHFCREQGYTVVLVNGFHVKQAKEMADNTPTKSDPKDAGVIARLVRDGYFFWPQSIDPVYADLRVVVDVYRNLGKEIIRVCNQIQSYLAVVFPEWKKGFKHIQGKAALWWLKNVPTPRQILAMSNEDLAQGLGSGYKRTRSLWQRALQLKAIASNSIGVAGMEQSVAYALKMLAEKLAYLMSQQHDSEQQIIKYLQNCGALAQRIQEIPGMGAVLTGQLLAYTGDLSQYEHYRQILKKAGLNLTHKSSGNKQGEKKISKRGKSALRSVLHRCALGLIRHCPEMNAYFQSFVQRRKNPLTKQSALVATSGKLVRILWSLAHTHEAFDASQIKVPAGRTA